MEVIILAISFIFSFVIFLLGAIKNSFTLSMIGSFLLILFAIINIIFGSMDLTDTTLYINRTYPNGTVEDMGKYDFRHVEGNDVYTFAISFVIGIFSTFLFLYTLMYLRNKPPRS